MVVPLDVEFNNLDGLSLSSGGVASCQFGADGILLFLYNFQSIQGSGGRWADIRNSCMRALWHDDCNLGCLDSWLTSKFRTSLSFQPSQYLTGHSDKQPHRHTSDPRHTEIQATTANSYSSEVQEVAWKKYGVEDIPMKQLGLFKNGDYEAQTNRESRWTKRSPAKRSELINPQASAQIWVWPSRKNLGPSKLQQFMSISQKTIAFDPSPLETSRPSRRFTKLQTPWNDRMYPRNLTNQPTDSPKNFP